MNIRGVNRWVAEERGTLEYDDTFDMTPEANQLALLGACQVARTAPCHVEACNFGTLVRAGEASCFMEGFDQFLRNTTGTGLPRPQGIKGGEARDDDAEGGGAKDHEGDESDDEGHDHDESCSGGYRLGESVFVNVVRVVVDVWVRSCRVVDLL